MGDDRVVRFRSLAARRICAAQYAFCGAGFAVLTFVVTAASWSGPLWVAGIVTGDVALGILVVRSLRIELVFDREGVVTRNVWWTSRARWSDIEAIGWRDTALIGSQYGSIDRPAVAFLRKGKASVLIADATSVLPEAERKRLVDELHGIARDNAIAIALDAADLRSYWLWPRKKPNAALDAKSVRKRMSAY